MTTNDSISEDKNKPFDNDKNYIYYNRCAFNQLAAINVFAAQGAAKRKNRNW